MIRVQFPEGITSVGFGGVEYSLDATNAAVVPDEALAELQRHGGMQIGFDEEPAPPSTEPAPASGGEPGPTSGPATGAVEGAAPADGEKPDGAEPQGEAGAGEASEGRRRSRR